MMKNKMDKVDFTAAVEIEFGYLNASHSTQRTI